MTSRISPLFRFVPFAIYRAFVCSYTVFVQYKFSHSRPQSHSSSGVKCRWRFSDHVTKRNGDSGDENEISSISPLLRAHDPECCKGKYRFDMTKFKRTQTRLVGHFALYWPLWLACMQFQTRKALTAGSTVITAIQAAPIFWGICLPPLPSPCHRGY